LTNRHVGQHVIDQPGRALDHLSRPAGGTETAALTTEGHQVLVATARANDSNEALFEPSAAHVALELLVHERGQRRTVRHIYFPNDAVVSLLYNVDGRRAVEVAMEGNEGAVGLAVYLGGVRSHNLSIVRDAGTAMRLEVKALRRCADQRGGLRELLHKSVHALVTQIALSGACSRFHNIDARLARCLLMTTDRVGSPELRATQESIARMLGVRRSGVTAARAVSTSRT